MSRNLTVCLALMLATLPCAAQVPQEAALVSVAANAQPLAAFVQELRERSGANILVAPGVDGAVTLKLTDAPWRTVLDLAAEQLGCVVSQRGAVTLVERPPRVTFDFAGAEIKSVIDSIARVSGTSIVSAPDVEGSVWLRLKDVPWRTALDTVARTLGFVVVDEAHGILRVVRPSALEAQLVTRVLPVRYLRPPPPYAPKIKSEYAEKANKTQASGSEAENFDLLRALRNALTAAGKIEYFSSNNVIVVKDIPPVVDEVERMLARMDVEPAQVYIDVKFVTTTNLDAFSYGIDIGANGLSASLSGASMPSRMPFYLGSGLSGQGVSDAMTPGTLDFTQMALTLNLLKEDRGSRIVQAPKLLAIDNQEATIFVGRTVRFAETVAESNQNGGLTYSIKEAANSPVQTGFQLYLVPHVIPGTDKVMMTVIPEAEQLVGNSTELPGFQVFSSGEGANKVSIALPQVASSTLVTTLLLESGHTAVIGGLISDNETDLERKVPLLGDIPLLGELFKSTKKSTVKESLIIFIMPRIIRDRSDMGQFLDAEQRKREEAVQREMERALGASAGPRSQAPSENPENSGR
jgi:type IV pilus assembly protein PilQ